MNCERVRVAASARLDGEPLGTSATALDAHLASCPDCARWAAQAERVTRLARLDVTPVPDLADRIVAGVVLPTRRIRRRRLALRVGLILAGLLQLLVGVPAMAGDSIGMAMSAHGAHEMAAWNIAIGASFLAAAWLPRRAAGLVPLLGTFLVVLGVLSVHDVADGAVGPDRLATHVAALAGLVLLIFLDRTERALQPGPVRAVVANEEDGRADLRTVA